MSELKAHGCEVCIPMPAFCQSLLYTALASAEPEKMLSSFRHSATASVPPVTQELALLLSESVHSLTVAQPGLLTSQDLSS